MPIKPKRPCSKPGCPELTIERYCVKHKHKVTENNRHYDRHVRDKKTVAFYHSIEWQRVREQALIRDYGLCQHCLRDKRITMADMVHHIQEVKKAWHLRLTLSNLLSLCNACHNKVDHSKIGG